MSHICANAANSADYAQETLLPSGYCSVPPPGLCLTLFSIHLMNFSLFTFSVNSVMLPQLLFLADAIDISINTANLYGNTALEPDYRVSIIVVTNIC